MTKKINVIAIIAGVGIGIIGSALASFVALMGFGIPISQLESAYNSNTALSVLDLVLSLAVVLLSGFVAGIIGKNGPTLNSTIAGVIQLLITILLFLPQINLTPLWYTVTTFLTIIPAAYLGGKIASKLVMGSKSVY